MFGEQTVCSPNNKNALKAVGKVGNNHGPSAHFRMMMIIIIIIIIIDNFCIALFSGVPKLTALYNQHSPTFSKFHKHNTYNYDN